MEPRLRVWNVGIEGRDYVVEATSQEAAIQRGLIRHRQSTGRDLQVVSTLYGFRLIERHALPYVATAELITGKREIK